jgi:hypothetical protein
MRRHLRRLPQPPVHARGRGCGVGRRPGCGSRPGLSRQGRPTARVRQAQKSRHRKSSIGRRLRDGSAWRLCRWAGDPETAALTGQPSRAGCGRTKSPAKLLAGGVKAVGQSAVGSRLEVDLAIVRIWRAVPKPFGDGRKPCRIARRHGPDVEWTGFQVRLLWC